MTTGIQTFGGSGSPGELAQLVDFTLQYHDNPAFAARADAEPRAALVALGVDVPPDTDVRISANTAETFHFIMPPDPNAVLADEDLSAVSGGTRCASSFISCLMSFSCS